MKEVNVVADKFFRFAVRGLLICTSFYVRNEKSLFCPNNYFEVERQ